MDTIFWTFFLLARQVLRLEYVYPAIGQHIGGSILATTHYPKLMWLFYHMSFLSGVSPGLLESPDIITIKSSRTWPTLIIGLYLYSWHEPSDMRHRNHKLPIFCLENQLFLHVFELPTIVALSYFKYFYVNMIFILVLNFWYHSNVNFNQEVTQKWIFSGFLT